MTAHDERRGHPRYQIELPGRLGRAGGEGHACLIRDHCVGGMLTSLRADADAGALFSVGDKVRISTRLQTDAGPSAIAVNGTVRWIHAGHLGIAFEKPLPVLVEALHRHARIVGEAAAKDSRPDPHNEGRCLARMRHVAQGSLPGILRGITDTTIATLLEGIEQLPSDAARQQAYADLTALEGLRERDLLVREVVANALNPVHGDDRAVAEGGSELRLVETDEFERWLEASSAATRLERSFGEVLARIGGRLASMRDGNAINKLSVPFEPRNFTNALKSVGEQLELGGVTRSVLFDCATRVLGDRLGPFYAELDKVLDTVGVASPSSKGPMSQVRKARHPGDDTAGQLSPAATAAPAGTSVTPDMPAAGDDVAAVRADAGMVAVDARALELLVARDRELRETQVRELLDRLANDTGRGQAMGEWLQLIDRPMVAEAVADPGFFHASHSPLLRIVDALGRLQLFRPTPERDVDGDALRQRINEVLAPLDGGSASAEQLTAIAAAMGDLVDEQSGHYQHNVQRVAEASEGRDRVRRAREAVSGELDRRYAGHPVPAIVPDLIDVGWRAVLELAWLNNATQPEQYEQRLALLDSVVDQLGGRAFAAESTVRDRPHLLARIGKELETAAFDPFRRAEVEQRLREELLGLRAVVTDLVDMPEQADAGAAPATERRPRDIPVRAWQKSLAACAGIHLGDRIRFVAADGADRELRVAWIRSDREAFTLVDHRGIRVRDIALVDLAAGVHQREIRLHQVDGRPLSGRGVDEMLTDMEERLAHLASHDSLTGLMNRRQFQGALDKALQTPHADNDTHGILMWVDIDQFKLINDVHGYATGDRLLVAVSALLQRLGGDMTLGHLGADRFAVLGPTTRLQAAEEWASRLCQEARQMPFDWNGSPMTLTVSVGAVALTEADDSSEQGGVIHAAENALAAAKRAGGDQVYVYRADDPDIVRQRDSVQWLARVDEALLEGELRLRCQPIVPVRPGPGIAPHYEVLLGVADGSREALSIAEFIEAAERYKRMRAVDRWVTRSVFDWIVAHRELMPALHGFAVNLSGQTASDPAFVDFVREQFARTAIDPEWISFEVTETAAVSSLAGTAGIIHELKHLGCKVALDDFGSGLASYAYLKQLPVDWLKIDGVFVRDIANDRDDYAVVKSINDIGHFLGKRTIAEYVKDQPTLDMVREIGVDYAQGFGISPPLLMDDLLPGPASTAASR